VVGDVVETLTAPNPWRSFGEWQRRIATTLANGDDEETRRSLAGIAIFGTPYVHAGADPGTVGE
jgi:hypothetical protein